MIFADTLVWMFFSLLSIAKSGFGFWKTSESGFHGFPFLPFDWETRKRICKTTLLNSGLLFANYTCTCKTAVLKNSFSNPFSDFRKKKKKKKKKKTKKKKKKKKKKRKESKSKRRYLSFETSFRIFLWIAKSEIRILKSKSRFPNHRTHPIYSCLVFWNSRHWG